MSPDRCYAPYLAAVLTMVALEVSMSRPPWEWNDLPDVLEASCKEDESLEAQSKAGVGYSSVASQIQVWPIGF